MKYKTRIQIVKKAFSVVQSGGFQEVIWFKGDKDHGQKLPTMCIRAVMLQALGGGDY